jgi:uncharacterized OB-fold protein
MSTITAEIPLVDYLVLDDGDAPHLRARQCGGCGALYFDRRNGCARCGGIAFASRALARIGSVRAFTIIHRAAPKVSTPFVSVIVDLDGGGVVKANLVQTPPVPESVPVGLRVELCTFPAGRDDDGTTAVAFGFRPRQEQK